MNKFWHWSLIVVWLGVTGMSPGAYQVYSKAVKFAGAGQDHFAFMHYSNLLRNFPNSEYRPQALFAIGEYYYQNAEYKKAADNFLTYLEENPESQDRIYALAYLLNLAERGDDRLFVNDLEKMIINQQQVSLVFRKAKETDFLSPMGHHYKVVTRIDKIEVFLEGALFAKVAY